MRTIEILTDQVSIELTEFEVMALAALVERGQQDVTVTEGDRACIGRAINRVAAEFRSLLGHFELVTEATK